MRTTGPARRGARATTACRWLRRVMPRDAGHRRQRVLSRLIAPRLLTGCAAAARLIGAAATGGNRHVPCLAIGRNRDAHTAPDALAPLRDYSATAVLHREDDAGQVARRVRNGHW